MVTLDDCNRINKLLGETIAVLCENAIKFKKELFIEGLLAVTVDSETVVLIRVKELLPSHNVSNVSTTPRLCRLVPGHGHSIMPQSTVSCGSKNIHQIVAHDKSDVTALPRNATCASDLSVGDTKLGFTAGNRVVARSFGRGRLPVKRGGRRPMIVGSQIQSLRVQRGSCTSRMSRVPYVRRSVESNLVPATVLRIRTPGEHFPALQPPSIVQDFSKRIPVACSRAAVQCSPSPTRPYGMLAVEAPPVLVAFQNQDGGLQRVTHLQSPAGSFQNLQRPIHHPVSKVADIEFQQGALNPLTHSRQNLAISSPDRAMCRSESLTLMNNIRSPQNMARPDYQLNQMASAQRNSASFSQPILCSSTALNAPRHPLITVAGQFVNLIDQPAQQIYARSTNYGLERAKVPQLLSYDCVPDPALSRDNGLSQHGVINASGRPEMSLTGQKSLNTIAHSPSSLQTKSTAQLMPTARATQSQPNFAQQPTLSVGAGLLNASYSSAAALSQQNLNVPVPTVATQCVRNVGHQMPPSTTRVMTQPVELYSSAQRVASVMQPWQQRPAASGELQRTCQPTANVLGGGNVGTRTATVSFGAPLALASPSRAVSMQRACMQPVQPDMSPNYIQPREACGQLFQLSSGKLKEKNQWPQCMVSENLFSTANAQPTAPIPYSVGSIGPQLVPFPKPVSTVQKLPAETRLCGQTVTLQNLPADDDLQIVQQQQPLSKSSVELCHSTDTLHGYHRLKSVSCSGNSHSSSSTSSIYCISGVHRGVENQLAVVNHENTPGCDDILNQIVQEQLNKVCNWTRENTAHQRVIRDELTTTHDTGQPVETALQSVDQPLLLQVQEQTKSRRPDNTTSDASSILMTSSATSEQLQTSPGFHRQLLSSDVERGVDRAPNAENTLDSDSRTVQSKDGPLDCPQSADVTNYSPFACSMLDDSNSLSSGSTIISRYANIFNAEKSNMSLHLTDSSEHEMECTYPCKAAGCSSVYLRPELLAQHYCNNHACFFGPPKDSTGQRVYNGWLDRDDRGNVETVPSFNKRKQMCDREDDTQECNVCYKVFHSHLKLQHHMTSVHQWIQKERRKRRH